VARSICQDLARKICRERRGVRDIPVKALRVIPRGKQRLTVYRAHQVFENSKFCIGFMLLFCFGGFVAEVSKGVDGDLYCFFLKRSGQRAGMSAER